jgi:PAP2 superfamily
MRLKLVLAVAALGALATPGLASADVVTDWNRNMADALLVAHTAPQPATRAGAIVQTAVFDAVNGIARRYEQFRPDVIGPTAPHGASQRAAAAGAAYAALVALLPAQKTSFDAELEATLASLADDDADEGLGQAVARGLDWGQTVANAILAWRSADGLTAVLPPYVIGPLPSWQPTPPAFVQTPVFRQFATMTPWTMSSPDEFLPPPPPALTGARYTADFNEVAAIGNAATATQALIDTAKFWNGVFETAGPMWNRAAERLADAREAQLVDNARLFALLNVSMADAVIAVWNAKNTYNSWRPVTAIRNADMDGNPATAQDATWTPVLTTPAHQEYPSGHSGVSGAAAAVLAAVFGNDTTFTVTSDGFPPTPFVARTYSSFSQAIDEVALARIAGGIHFRSACETAAHMGAEVADQAMDAAMTRLHGPAS